MAVKVNFQTAFLEDLNLISFNERFPWWGGDLQTLRDTFVAEKLPSDKAEKIKIEVPPMPCGRGSSGYLIAYLDTPLENSLIRGLVLILHGLGGSSRRRGLRRMTYALVNAGFAVMRLNLRGADPTRRFVAGTYAASCNSDLKPVIDKAREVSKSLVKKNNFKQRDIPLFGVGLSLGGTILLNSCLHFQGSSFDRPSPFDGLVCVSSPLDLVACSESIERFRNGLYQTWLLKRLVRQTLCDPFGITDSEKEHLLGVRKKGISAVSSIRQFDAAITAPRWGFKNVDEYYKVASPLEAILKNPFVFSPLLILQSSDDPWVPSKAAEELQQSILKTEEKNKFDVLITANGGHNGFHGEDGCWGDQLVVNWLLKILSREI